MTVTLFPRFAESLADQGANSGYAPPVLPPVIAVVIPCFRARDRVLAVLERIGPEVEHVFVVDDACPEGTGLHVQRHCRDSRVAVLFHAANKGVGGAVRTGYRHALRVGADIAVKIDGDGQMDPALLPRFVAPILAGQADYAKGNRFHDPEGVRAMPAARLFGNAVLSFLTKMSTGYWQVFDPTNGYTAIHARALAALPLDKIQERYFFETDMLFRLGTVGAVVADVPMAAVYDDHPSGLKIGRVLLPFLLGHGRNTAKRVVYNYFLRSFSLASLQLLAGLALLLFGTAFGASAWLDSIRSDVPATTGTVMLAALPVLIAIQLLLSFLAHDLQAVPTRPLHRLLLPQPGPVRRTLGAIWAHRAERSDHRAERSDQRAARSDQREGPHEHDDRQRCFDYCT